jgi:hypothetical protein
MVPRGLEKRNANDLLHKCELIGGGPLNLRYDEVEGRGTEDFGGKVLLQGGDHLRDIVGTWMYG